jgi:hypothetical protein
LASRLQPESARSRPPSRPADWPARRPLRLLKGTHYAFLQSGQFLAGGGVPASWLRDSCGAVVRELVATAGVALGGLLFAGVLAAHHDAAWPGLIGGRARRGARAVRLAPGARRRERAPERRAARFAVALYADAAALVLALLLVRRAAVAARARLLRAACAGRSAGAPWRGSPASGCCAEEARPRRDRRRPAGDDRAGRRRGRAPCLATLIERGSYSGEAVAAFPSVTPVCAATIATGLGPGPHRIPSMNWYHREEGRYVEYGSSFRAALRFGLGRQLTDTIYNMNGAHLAPDA